MIPLPVSPSPGYSDFEEKSCGEESFSNALQSLKSFILTMLGSFPPLRFGYTAGRNYGTSVGSVIISLLNFEK